MAATPSSRARCHLPAAPPNQTASEQVRRYACSREPQYISTCVCGRRLRVRQLLRVLSPCCVLRSSCSCLASDTYGCVDIWMCKSIALKLSARCVPPRGAAQHQPRGCAAHSSSVRTTRLIIRLLLRFELPDWYFGTTRLIIRLVVQLIIRLVVNYQLQADNPADNQAVSFVVYAAPRVVRFKSDGGFPLRGPRKSQRDGNVTAAFQPRCALI